MNPDAPIKKKAEPEPSVKTKIVEKDFKIGSILFEHDRKYRANCKIFKTWFYDDKDIDRMRTIL